MIRKNENGYTLLLTLAIILIITSFIGTLSFLTLNQQTQVENTDEDFLLSDITEMGIEYYRSRVFEDYVRIIKQVEKNINEELNNFPKKYETKKEVEDLEIKKELEGIRDLKAILCTDEARANLCAYEVKAIPIEEPKLTFSLIESPYEFESTETYIQFKFLIEGSNSINQEKYSFNIRLPKNLVDLTITNFGNGTGTISDSFFNPPVDTKYCNNDYKDTICISNSDKKKESIKNIVSSTVYFIGDTVVNNANHHDFNESLLIINGNLEAQNFKSDKVSIFVNGNTSFDHFEVNKLSLYSSGTLNLTKHITISNSKIRSIGPLQVINNSNESMKITNSHLLMEGSNNYIESLDVKDSSTVCIKNDSTIDDLKIDESSDVLILNSVKRMEYDLNSTKEPITVDIDTFNKSCYEISDSNGGIDVGVISNVNVTPESILNEIDYDVTD